MTTTLGLYHLIDHSPSLKTLEEAASYNLERYGDCGSSGIHCGDHVVLTVYAKWQHGEDCQGHVQLERSECCIYYYLSRDGKAGLPVSRAEAEAAL